ncbi:hypothetical protein AL073_07000 [Loktanella sp. 1ANDIMAR09]|nr:hypothetical protein AL073_07000 [Loktanella sp. 1ANDIMAR09]
MFASVVFPIADFRSVHPQSAGRLDKPKWGEQNPQAKFARGFGSIHTRTKSGVGFIGENYYADCENLVKYPSQTFVSALLSEHRSIVTYPVYRRFYFDGQMSGRFEFGFRLNEASIQDVKLNGQNRGTETLFDYMEFIRQLLTKEIELHVPDGRSVKTNFLKASDSLRDAYLISSTQNAKLAQYDITSVGSKYVSVGPPFVFVRSGLETPVSPPKGHRAILTGNFDMIGSPSGCQGRSVDAIIVRSSATLDGETENERFARLAYTQLRALSFAHSFFLRQVDDNELTGISPLEPAIASMLDRLRNLSPLEDDRRDAEVCNALTAMLEKSDISPERLSLEIHKRLKRGWLQKLVPNAFRYLDKKSDVAIEAAASTATKYALTGGL